MIIVRIFLLITVTCLCIASGSSGQHFTVVSKSWELKDGLSNRHVNNVVEDQFGFIWVGTRNGIQRFDGQEFKTWNERTGFPQFSDIRWMIIDDDGWLWAWDHTKQAYACIHTVTEKVHTQHQHFRNKLPKKYHPESKNWAPVWFVAKNKKGTLFAVSRQPNELLTYHSKKGFKRFPLKLGKGITQLEIAGVNSEGIALIVLGKKNKIVRVTYDGKIRQEIELNHTSGWFVNRFNRPEATILINEFIVSQDPQTLGKSVSWKVDWYSGKLIRRQQKAVLRTHSSAGLGCVIQDGQLELWKNNQRIHVAPAEQYGKIFSDAYPVLVDSKHRIWFASSFGLARMIIRPNGFQNLVKKDVKNPLNFNTSARALVVRNDTLFALFEFHGIAAIPLKNPGNITPIHGNFSPDAHYYNTFSMIDDDGSLVFARNGKLMRINGSNIREVGIEAADKSGRYKPLGESAVVNAICAFKGRYWMGVNDELWAIRSNGKGTYFNVSNKPENPIRVIKPFQGNLLICSAEGLFRFNIKKQRIEKVNPGKIGKRLYSCMYTDEHGIFYFGTDKGLLKWNPRTDAVKVYSEKHGLSQNMVTGVYPDAHGNLWIATFYGLNKLHLKTGKITSFYEEDGINHAEFNFLSHFQDNNGKIYFGGLNGITVIDPAKIASHPFTANKIHLTEAALFTEEANQLKDLTGSLRLHKQFTYRTDDRFIRLKFAIPNLNNQDDILYAWKISGLHDTWNYQKENSIQLTNLPYGDQVLLIKGKTDEGIWTTPLRITIYVEPPFYLRIWFLILSGITLIFGIIVTFRLRTKTLRKRELQLRKEIRMATETIRQDNILIRKQADDLRALDKTKSRFFTNITHELKTPLALIKGPLGSVLNSGKLDKETEQHVLTAKRNTEHLLKLVSSLLDLSKLESGMMKVDETEVNLFEFFTRIISHFESHIRQAGIFLEVRFNADKNLTVRLDKNKCETVLNNLLSNAVKFTHAGGNITVTFENQEDLLFSISDTGRGIPPAEQERIFERFYQVSSEEITEEGGTGIGLSLSLELVKVMNGSLTVQSEPGVGSTFELRLPKRVTGVSAKTVPSTETQPLAESPISSGGERKILIVEDNPDLQHYLASIMFSNGFSTLNAYNGKQALELLHQLPADQLPDIILSDIMMPEMDGYQLLTHLKQDERYWNIPVIILTARSELQDKLKALRIGVDDYLLKPFEEEELLARVHNLVKHLAGRNESPDIGEENEIPLALTPVDQNWMKQLEAFVQEHYTEEEFDIAQMHAHFAMSSSTFLRKVKALTGMAPVDYLREFRLIAARRLLENKEKTTVSEVAFAVGFGNAKSFSRSFRNRFGKLPGDYLK